MSRESRGAGDEIRTDHELLEATRAGEPQAFGAFYRRHRATVLAFLVGRAGDPETAADLLAESFAAALRFVLDREQQLPDLPVAWLMRIARNKLVDGWRRGRVEAVAREQLGMEPLRLTDADLSEIEQMASETDLLADLAALLPAGQLAALRARVLEERSYPDIARSMSCSEAVVRKRVSRALATLRGLMEDST